MNVFLFSIFFIENKESPDIVNTPYFSLIFGYTLLSTVCINLVAFGSISGLIIIGYLYNFNSFVRLNSNKFTYSSFLSKI